MNTMNEMKKVRCYVTSNSVIITAQIMLQYVN